jgi:hypothetical protein
MTDNEPTIFDAIESARRATESADRAYNNAPNDWRQHIYATIETVARMKPTFTADDVYEWCAIRGLPLPNEGRSVGAVFRTMAAQRIIVATGEFRNSAKVSKHAAPTRVWRLNI